MNYLYPFLSVMAVSLISLIGTIFLSFKTEFIRKYIFVLISLAVGALLGDAFVHLIPESFENIANPLNVSLLLIFGIFSFFVLEKILHWHHHESECKEEHPVGKLILVSDGLHNFIDGLIIGVSYVASTEAGIATTIAVILHEIPQEIGDFGVLIHAGFSKFKAILFNFLSGLFALVGLVFSFLLGEWSSWLAISILPIAAGGFIYIAMSDLIPELNKTKAGPFSFAQLLVVAIGIVLMVLLLKLD